ncbi:MAG: DedA family protein [Rhodospirillaceae bacterium]|nr:DedA family protein [Rhodospirillaceae bacterium]
MSLEELLQSWGYVAILIGTFLEGETIVIFAGVFASQGMMSLPLVFATALFGTFFGDQVYFTIGKRWGSRLLYSHPALKRKTRSVFRLLKKYETGFILSFRFVYGLRNVSPFVIGMNGIPHARFAILNFIAAFVWATIFAGGGYLLGVTLENFIGKMHGMILLIILGIVVLLSAISIIIGRIRGNRDPRIQRLRRMQAFRQAARSRATTITAEK